MKTLRSSFLFGFFILLIGCVYTKHPVLNTNSQRLDRLPKSFDGHYEIKFLPDDEQKRFGTSMVEFQQTTPTKLQIFAYEAFTQKDLKENPRFRLNGHCLTFESINEGILKKKEFKVTPVNGKFIYARLLKYELDLEKNALIIYEGEKEYVSCYLKKYNGVFILNMLLNEGWGTVLIESKQDGTISFRHIDYNTLMENSDHFTTTLGPIEVIDSVFVHIDPSDSEMKNLLGDQDFFKPLVELRK